MELAGDQFKKRQRSLTKLLSTRKGTALVGGVCALLAAGILLFAAASYRHSVNAGAQPETVLVATNLIQKGTPASAISSGGYFKAEQIPTKEASVGVIADAAVLQGRVAASDIQPGSQLTFSDFAAGGGIASTLAPSQRAISISLDASHGLSGTLQPGDRVDVYAGLSTGAGAALRLLIPDVVVMSTGAGAGGGIGSNSANATSNVVLKVASNDAGKLAFAADNGKVWLILRGPNAATTQQELQAQYSANSILLGSQTGGRR